MLLSRKIAHATMLPQSRPKYFVPFVSLPRLEESQTPIFNYRELGWVNTPRKSPVLTRVFARMGLDKIIGRFTVGVAGI